MIPAALLVLFLAWVLAPSTDMARHSSLEPVRVQDIPDSPVKITFVGTSTLLFEDGETALLVDGFFSRPSKAHVLFGMVRTNHCKVHEALDRLGVRKLAAVLVVHSHYDHALDSAYIANHTGAILAGSESTRKVDPASGRGRRGWT